MLHVTDIQYMFVKQNGKTREKNAREQNETGKETQWNRTERGGRNTTERNSRFIHIPFSFNGHPVARFEWGNLFLTHAVESPGLYFLQPYFPQLLIGTGLKYGQALLIFLLEPALRW